MSDAEDAYTEAQLLIAEAKDSGASTLALGKLKTGSLRALPPEIVELTTLTNLNLLGARIVDWSVLVQLKTLTALHVGYIKEDGLAAVAQLTSLTELTLKGNRLYDLTPISSLTALTRLDFSGQVSGNLGPLTKLEALTYLDFSGTYVKDISPLTHLNNLTTLKMSHTRVTDFSPLSAIRTLVNLDLYNTWITDLVPLSPLTAVTTLILSRARITDLSPLVGLTGLLTPGQSSLDNPTPGLHFDKTPACDAPRIAEIADIKDPALRVRTLFDYLKTGRSPVPEDSTLVPAYRVHDTGPISSTDDPFQGGDEDQEDLRQDLIRKSSALVAAIGDSNAMAILKGAAEHYQRQISKPLSHIRVNLLYSAANSLRVAYEADLRADQLGNLSDLLPPPVSAPLRDLVETHALFFMGFANAAQVQQTMLAGLTGSRNPQQVALAASIVTALEGKSLVLDLEDQQALADDLAGAKGQGASAEIAERRLFARLGNIFGAVGRKVYREMRDNAKPTAIVLIQYDIIAFVLGQQTIIGAFLKSMQGAGAAWFDVVAQFLMRP